MEDGFCCHPQVSAIYFHYSNVVLLMTRSHTINSRAVRDREKERKREKEKGRERICGISQKHFSPHLSDLLACFFFVCFIFFFFFLMAHQLWHDENFWCFFCFFFLYLHSWTSLTPGKQKRNVNRPNFQLILSSTFAHFCSLTFTLCVHVSNSWSVCSSVVSSNLIYTFAAPNSEGNSRFSSAAPLPA